MSSSKYKPGILLVAFGTSIPEAQAAYHHIEKRVSEAYPNLSIRWGYTAAMVRRKLAKQGQLTYSPSAALALMADEGFTHVAVQSLHVIPGFEYHDMLEIAKAIEGLPKGIQQISVGEPLLCTHADIQKVTEVLCQWSQSFRAPGEGLAMMGHGTHHWANVFYPGIQYYFDKIDKSVIVGTVEGFPELDDVMERLRNNQIKTLWLMPFLTVAGDHALNDMAGDEDDSWKSILEKEGFEVKPLLTGLGMIDPIVDIWIEHLNVAVEAIKN